ncbi:hypothetical protein [Anaeromyxobacter oryzae]|uniref:Uncharacterized protein n=1 Tax=Anaeromyxobacter oryzae TaxID=2918170 RepID=A0ABN6MV09_9BACT|nr:hypothetical protein [Anaeromyxobacter oryzae]BDG04802.1 hypothetical protein AMOR_37980 [Anaeromyxobacter oryzae]
MLESYDRTLPYRIAFGLAFFGALALWEVFRRGRESQRLREYGFLLFATVASVAFALLHDQVTATISPEYFLTAKGLANDPRPFRAAVAILAVKASYWVGLVIGTTLLVANNPSPRRPQIGYAMLVKLAALPLLFAVLGAAVGAAMFRGIDLGLRSAAIAVVGAGAASRFLVVWGIHAGSYLGALVGGIAAVTIVVRRRRRFGAAAAADIEHAPLA